MLRDAGLAESSLRPDVTELLDTEALVMGIVAGKVAIGLETLLRVAAIKEELLEVAHDYCCELDRE